MVLVDTNVWIQHLKQPRVDLIRLLEQNLVLTHPLIVGELACGSLRQRHLMIEYLLALPRAAVAEFAEVLAFLERHHLYSRGLGMVDMSLLASTLISGARLLTDDKRLRRCAAQLGVAE